LAVALLANPAEMSAHRQPRQLLPSQRLCLYLPLLIFTAERASAPSRGWTRVMFVCFGAGRYGVRLLTGSYQDYVNWYCSLLTSCTDVRKNYGVYLPRM